MLHAFVTIYGIQQTFVETIRLVRPKSEKLTFDRGSQVKRESERRRWPVEEKCRIVEQTLKPGASVARVALAHGVNANQVFSWRRQYRQGLLGKRNAGPVNLDLALTDPADLGQAVAQQCILIL